MKKSIFRVYMKKTKSQRRKSYKRKSYKRGGTKKQHSPQNKTTVGLIHAEWCGHCQTLMPIWKRMVSSMKGNKKFHVVEIESSDSDKDSRMSQINSKLSSDSEKLEANGFPTVFKVKNGKLEYYNEERQEEAMKKWFSL